MQLGAQASPRRNLIEDKKKSLEQSGMNSMFKSVDERSFVPLHATNMIHGESKPLAVQ